MSWLLFPFIIIGCVLNGILEFCGWLVRFLLGTVGRVISFGIGLAVLCVGAALTATLFGAIIGVPLCLFSIALILGSFT